MTTKNDYYHFNLSIFSKTKRKIIKSKQHINRNGLRDVSGLSLKLAGYL